MRTENFDAKACLTRADQAISDDELGLADDKLGEYIAWRRLYPNGEEPIEVAGTLMRGDAFYAYCARRLADAELAKEPRRGLS
jgi:hypothetical protein